MSTSERKAFKSMSTFVDPEHAYFGSKDSFFDKDGKNYARTDAHAYLTDEEYAAHKAGKFATEGERG